MQAIFFIASLVIGLVQMAATYSALTDLVGLHWLLASLAMLFLGWMPLVGTGLGVAGAVYVWGWTWLAALALFFGLLALMLAAGGLSAAMERQGAAAR